MSKLRSVNRILFSGGLLQSRRAEETDWRSEENMRTVPGEKVKKADSAGETNSEAQERDEKWTQRRERVVRQAAPTHDT